MSKEILIIIWMGVMGVLSTQIQFKKIEFVEDKKVVRYSMGFALFVFCRLLYGPDFGMELDMQIRMHILHYINHYQKICISY